MADMILTNGWNLFVELGKRGYVGDTRMAVLETLMQTSEQKRADVALSLLNYLREGATESEFLNKVEEYRAETEAKKA